jgi:hypothetical protein
MITHRMTKALTSYIGRIVPICTSHAVQIHTEKGWKVGVFGEI